MIRESVKEGFRTNGRLLTIIGILLSRNDG